MPRVGEAGAQHALIAGDDEGATVLGRDVGHEGEPGRGFVVWGAQGEVALVDAHGDLHDLARQIHMLVGNAAEQRHRAFDQTRDFIHQAGIVHDGAALRRRQFGHTGRDHALAVGRVHQDMAFGELRLPVGGGGHSEGAGGVEAVALGQIAARQAVAVISAIGQGERHHRAIQQADDAAQRADPDEAAAAAPAHGFWPGEAAQHRWHRLGDQAGGGDRGGGFVEDPEIALLP